MTRKELDTLIALIPDGHRLMFRLLASTGLRISEAVALQWRHVQLDGSAPHVKIRRALVKGRMGPPKSRHGRRQVPIDYELVLALRKARKDTDWPDDEHLVFPAGNSKPLGQPNLYRDALKGPREEANLSWVGFHTFRHSARRCCSRRVATPCRSSGGSGTTPRRSRSPGMSTCWTATWGSR